MRLQTAGSRTLPAIEAVVERESGFPDLQNLLRSAIDVRPNQNLPLISKAYHFAELAHRNLRRKSGDPAITHAVAVCRILIDLGLDSATAAAGLLHDVVDETDVPLAQIESHFGAEIAGLVDGVSKIKDFSFQSPEAEQAENFRKMLLSMARDLRVVLIKLADRLHNMRTLKFMRPESQERMVYESRDIYAPLAHRLGMSRIRAELEDLSLKWLDPKAYRYIQEKINLTREEREACIEAVRKPLSEALEKAGIQADMTGRSKNFGSIYKKMNGRERAFDEIYDLLALRVLVDTVPECYNVLGLVHTMYPPVTARFKDFIATPKSNMYQSLHTTIIGPSGMMLEVQIRTRKMHQTAEVGIAAHWLYKEGKRGPSEMDRHMAWLRSLLEWQRETTSPQEFMDELKVDLFPNEIFVFTPKGDLIQLPEGATPLDFAFAVHTDVGLRCIGSRVDDQMVSLSTPLRTGSYCRGNHLTPPEAQSRLARSCQERPGTQPHQALVTRGRVFSKRPDRQGHPGSGTQKTSETYGRRKTGGGCRSLQPAGRRAPLRQHGQRYAVPGKSCASDLSSGPPDSKTTAAGNQEEGPQEPDRDPQPEPPDDPVRPLLPAHLRRFGVGRNHPGQRDFRSPEGLC